MTLSIKVDFTADDIMAHAGGLTVPHVAILTYAMTPGMKYATIATAMNIKVGTVRSRLNRARSALRALKKDATPAPGIIPAGFDGEEEVTFDK